MSYTHATGKSRKDLVSYQSVRGADVKAIFQEISELTPLKQLYSDFGRPRTDGNSTSTIDDAVQFLHAIDFVERPDDRTVKPIEGQPFADLPFELRILHHLKQQSGNQEHFMELHRLLAKQDTQFYNKELLVEEAKRELEYSFDWNTEKVQTWYNLVGPLGLVSVHDNQEILTSPSPRLVYDLLSAFMESEDGSNRIRDALNWIEDQFCSCFAQRGGTTPTVHRGLAETLSTMQYDDSVTLTSMSDTHKNVSIPTLQSRTTSSFEIGERPTRPAYEYPLAAHRVEVSQ
ncbi:hypothetical protein [Halobaculum marinum]|uniref:Uncharacterized protein n=1 Tax=Halobaculum marinum TaxID=3031996 RepID=A0ABD5WUF4_9EURY|nr:hypothetical protein [Halobaculum sp. DT55]